MKKLLLTICFLLLAGNVHAAATHYIRDGGIAPIDGTGSCTGWATENACDSLPVTLVRGDTYYIADGSYGSRTFNAAVSGTLNIYIKKATVADHGTSTGWSDSYGDGQAAFASFYFVTGYYDIDGQVGGGPQSWDSGFGFTVISSKGKRVIFQANSSNINIKHTEITNTDATANGVNYGSLIYSFGNVTNVTFSYCKIHHVYGCCIQGGFSGIKNWTIEYSKVGDNYGDSNHSEIWSRMGADNFTWRYNYIYSWRSTGAFYAVGPGSDGTGDANISENIHIYGNIFDQGGTTASWLIAAYRDGSYDFQYARGWRVYNNTFININSTSVWVYTCALSTTGTADNEFKNNVIYGNSDGMQVWGVTQEHNSYQGSSQFWTGANNVLLTSSPFTNYSGGNYTLSGSVAGYPLSSPYNVDMYGVTRAVDGVWDRGAYEFNSGQR